MDTYFFFIFHIESGKHEEVFPEFPNNLLFIPEYICRHFLDLLLHLASFLGKANSMDLK